MRTTKAIQIVSCHAEGEVGDVNRLSLHRPTVWLLTLGALGHVADAPLLPHSRDQAKAGATANIVHDEIKTRTSALGDIEIRELARFLDSARGDQLAEQPRDETIKEAHDWLRNLHADLEFDAVWWSLDHENGYSMTALLHMMRRSDN